MSATVAHPHLDRPRPRRRPHRARARRSARAHRRSGEYFERARGVMPGGVPSQFQKNDPWPVYLERGSGAQVWDVDGNEYIDFHNGFGVMCVGHANPIDRRRRQGADGRGHPLRRADRGLDHRRRGAAPPLGPARTGASRTPAPSPRWTPSTSRAASPAATSIVKIEGTYHGHHDAVMVSVKPPPDKMGDRAHAELASPYGLGYAPGTASTRASCRSTTPTRSTRCSRARRPGRRRDHGAGDDEHQHRPARRRLPRARARAHARARRPC